MPKAFSYVRFSTSEQEHGDSYRRQTEKALKFIHDHPELNLELDESLNLYDKGISAYKGKNVLEGKLSTFMKAVEDGTIPRGSFLLVENHDRLSRDKVAEALHRFTSILRMGITIVTLSDSKIFSIDQLNEVDLIISLIVMSRAHSESEMKGERIKSAWMNKKNNIDKQKLTKWCPKWLNLSQDRTHFEIIPERAEVIKKIFEWSVNGLGIALIIKRLESLNIHPWDNGTVISQKRLPKKWHTGIIQRFLNDRTVLGEYKLKNSNLEEGYEIIHDYYPQIIDDELFYLSMKARKDRKVSKASGRKGKTLSNLFSKIAICGYSVDNNLSGFKCAGSNQVMLYSNKNTKGKTHLNYMQCSRVRDGNTGCESCRKMWKYDHFEKSFLTHVKDIDASVLFGQKNDANSDIERLKNQIDIESGKLHNIKDNIKKITASIEAYDAIPKFLIDQGNKLEKEEKEILIKIESLKDDLKIKEHQNNTLDQKSTQLHKVIDLLESLKVSDEIELFDTRLKLSNLLKSAIASIEIYASGMIMDEERIKKITKEMDEDDINRFNKNNELTKKTSLPFFVVNYKSGEKRLIHVDPKNSMELIQSMKWNAKKILDKEFKGFSKTVNTR